MSKKIDVPKEILLMEDDSDAATLINRLSIFGYTIVRANDLLDLVAYIEKMKKTYFAILLDVGVEGQRFKDHEGVLRKFLDPQKMNGLEYYQQDQALNPTEEQKQEGWGKGVLTSYIESGRFGFYSSYVNVIQTRAIEKNISIDGCELFDKNNLYTYEKILKWIDIIEKQNNLLGSGD